MALRQAHASRALDTLLARARQDSAEFPALLANHLPMGLVALAALGASDDRLEGFADTYRRTSALVPVPPAVEPLTPQTWPAALGQRHREADTRAVFAAMIARDGLRRTVAAALPTLLPGIGASALHGLMRLAYGTMRGDAAEVAVALGSWTATYLAMPPATGAPPRTDDPAAVLAGVAALEPLRAAVPESDLLWHNIRAVGWTPAFAPVIDWLAIGEGGAEAMAAVSLRLFAGTMDFAALHAVTGMHWARLILPFAARPADVLRPFWQVIAALVPKLGCPALPDEVTLARQRQAPCPDWPVIAAAAAASDDEHDISLVFSAREEERTYGDRLYRVVAARRVGLIA